MEMQAAARRVLNRVGPHCKAHYRSCPLCAAAFVTGKVNQRFCSLRCQRRFNENRGDKQRAKTWGVAYETIDRKKVYDRDDWTCGLCGEPIDPTLKGPDPWCASLDHVTPMSKGGPHLYSNVQAAHLWCNQVKHDDPTRMQCLTAAA